MNYGKTQPLKIAVMVTAVALISIILAITINPVEFVRFQRDRQRVNDLKNLSSLISSVESQNPEVIHSKPNVIYTSLPDDDPDCSSWNLPSINNYRYHCAASDDYLNINGTGWVPIDFTILDDVPEKLLVDPRNGRRGRDSETGQLVLYHYRYLAGSFTLSATLESGTAKNDLIPPSAVLKRLAAGKPAEVFWGIGGFVSITGGENKEDIAGAISRFLSLLAQDPNFQDDGRIQPEIKAVEGFVKPMGENGSLKPEPVEPAKPVVKPVEQPAVKPEPKKESETMPSKLPPPPPPPPPDLPAQNFSIEGLAQLIATLDQFLLVFFR